MKLNEIRDGSGPSRTPGARIKWGYAAARVPRLPASWDEVNGRVATDANPPRAGDVLLAEVLTVGRHRRLDLRDRTKSQLFPGDLVGLVFARRYATRQFEAIVPETLDNVHFVCAGGVCGTVVGIPAGMTPPTALGPLGYLRDAHDTRVNIRDHAIRAAPASYGGAPEVIVAVGSSMDSGKTTAAYSLVNGLTRGAARVAAAKITGTASMKDPMLLRDAGALAVLDFTDAGFGSTAGLGTNELAEILDTVLSNLAAKDPDYIVLEIADGITQPETVAMLDLLLSRGIAKVLYTCNDSLGVGSGVGRLRSRGLNVVAVSGTTTSSPLSAAEAQSETNAPVLTREDLADPGVRFRLGMPTSRRDQALPRAAATPPLADPSHGEAHAI